MTDQKRKKATDFLGLKVLSTLDERLIIGGTMGVVEHHDHHDGVLQHEHHDHREEKIDSVVNPLF